MRYDTSERPLVTIAKLPVNQFSMLCKALVFNATNAVRLDKIPLIIAPKSRTKIIPFTRIRLISRTNKDVPTILRATANSNLTKMGLLGRNNSDVKIPDFAYSIISAVVGLTNLFCIICYMVNPDKASGLPESRVLTVLGTRLENRMFTCSSPK